MKKIASFILLVSLLTSCGPFGSEEDIADNQDKQDFFVDIIDFSQLNGQTIINKVGQVNSSQDIELSANANGRVQSVNVKVGDKVSAGQVIANLDDSIGNYGISLQRSNIGINSAQINYDSTKLSLEKQIFDAQKNLENLERNLKVALEDSAQSLIQAENDLSSSKYTDLDTAAALSLEQLDNNIAKSKLEYEIKVQSDNNQIETFKANTKKEFQNIRTQILDIIDFTDQILGVSDKNKRKNDKFEDFLGANDVGQRRQAELALLELISLKEDERFNETIGRISKEINTQEMQDIISFTGEIYESMLSTLIELQTTLNNSTTSLGALSPAELSGYISQVNGLQGQVQGAYTGFISTRSMIRSFLSTYEDSQKSILKSIALQEKDKDIQLKNLQNAALSAETGFNRTNISIEDRIESLKQNIEIAKNNLENAIANKEVTLRNLENNISDAKVGYASASKEYNKLTIRSPISGTIAAIKVDVGQEIGVGTPLFNIVSNGDPEVQIAFSANEKDFIYPGQSVTVSHNGVDTKGTIYAISDVADSKLNYPATIVFESGTDIIGSLVDVQIQLESEKRLIPINIVEVQEDNIGFLQTFSGSEIIDVRVRLGDVYGENIEVVSCAKNCSDLRVIKSDISNYNPNNFVIREK